MQLIEAAKYQWHLVRGIRTHSPALLQSHAGQQSLDIYGCTCALLEGSDNVILAYTISCNLVISGQHTSSVSHPPLALLLLGMHA